VYKVDSSSLLPLTAETRTRGHGFKLLKKHCRSQLRSNFFSMHVVNSWNSLPDDVVTAVVTAPTLNTFKNRIDKTWKWKHMRYKLDTNIFDVI
jgi:hypothetical protein